jgi:hypothetical protein
MPANRDAGHRDGGPIATPNSAHPAPKAGSAIVTVHGDARLKSTNERPD